MSAIETNPPEQKRKRSSIILGKHDLAHKKVVLVGVGGTGCTIATLLARQGIPLTIIDRDIVEEHNLERQTLFEKKDIGKAKVVAAEEKLSAFSKINAFFEDLTEENITKLIPPDTDLIIDATDNNESRLIINDVAKKHKIPWMFSAAVARQGSVALFMPDQPCFQCIYSEKYGETCAEAGVLPSTVTAIASYVVDAALLFLAKNEQQKELTFINLETKAVTQITPKHNPNCAACKENYTYLHGEKTKKVVGLCGKDKFAFHLQKKLNLEELAGTLAKQGKQVQQSEYAVKTDEFLIFAHGRIVVTAPSKEAAKKLFDEQIGIQ